MVLKAIALSFPVLYLTGLLYQNRRKAGEPPVVWSWLPMLGSAIAFGAAPLKFVCDKRDSHGDVFVTQLSGLRMVWIADPRSWPNVFRASGKLAFGPMADMVLKGAFMVGEKAMKVTGSGTQMDKTFHGMYQPMLANAQSQTSLAETADAAIATAIARHFAAPANGKGKVADDGFYKVPLMRAVFATMFDATMETFYGPEFVGDEALQDFLDYDKRFPLLVAGVPAGAFPKALAAYTRSMNRFFDSKQYNSTDGAASELIRMRKKILDENIESKEEHARIQMTIIWATVANTLPAGFWVIYWVVRDPELNAAIRAEIDALGGPTAALLALAKGGAVAPRLNAAIDESLRLATGSLTSREVMQDCELALSAANPTKLFKLRKGDRIALFPPVAHFDAEMFPDPHTFDSRRFLPKDGAAPVFTKGGDPVKHALMPFGGGTTLCPGRHFARREIAQVVVHVISTFDLKLEPGPLGTLPPVPAMDTTRVGLGIYSPADDTLEVFCRLRA